MTRFHILDGAAVILKQRGVFRQVDVYARSDEIYAPYRDGYLQLLALRGAIGDTSVPDVTWNDLFVPSEAGSLSVDTFGRPILGGRQ